MALSGLFATYQTGEKRRMTTILQNSIPFEPRFGASLPGISPLDADGWIIKDEAFAAQMALRDTLLEHSLSQVHADVGADPAAKSEVLAQVLDVIRNRDGYEISDDGIIRPDGVRVALDDDPMLVAARLVQEDLCLHEKRGNEHVLTAAVLCFPASWTLSEKIGKPLTAIHETVPEFDAQIAKRVQRLFDGIQADRPLWRYNIMRYRSPELFHPRKMTSPREQNEGGAYLRSEHQAFVRMPISRAVLFAIHTYVVRHPQTIAGETDTNIA